MTMTFYRAVLGFFPVNYELKLNAWFSHSDSILLSGQKLAYTLLLWPIRFVETETRFNQNRFWIR